MLTWLRSLFSHKCNLIPYNGFHLCSGCGKYKFISSNGTQLASDNIHRNIFNVDQALRKYHFTERVIIDQINRPNIKFNPIEYGQAYRREVFPFKNVETFSRIMGENFYSKGEDHEIYEDRLERYVKYPVVFLDLYDPEQFISIYSPCLYIPKTRRWRDYSEIIFV
jgi:hypothetical protein